MNSSILQYDEATQRCTITLRQGPWVGRVFSGSMRVCCQPTCGCGKIDFRCIESTQPGLNFSLDTLTRTVSALPDGVMSAEERLLAGAVVAELQQTDWKMLFGLLCLAKTAAIANVDPATLDLKSPVKIEMGDRDWVAFSTIFPYGSLRGVQSEGTRWLVDDLYSVDPGSRNHEVILSFIPEGDNPVNKDNLPAVFYDYKRRKLGKVLLGLLPGTGVFKDLVAKLREQYEAFELEIEKRHMTLRILYLRCLQEQGNVLENSEAASPRQDIGRNDPCPCGSGKKYKRCCGGVGADMPDDL